MIMIDLENNKIAVTDNGIGFEEQQYIKFLAPNFSFKNGNTRGHKGVGSTYLAYGFNYIQISTKSPEFSARGKMLNAKKWLSDDNPASNPLVIPDSQNTIDPFFDEIDRGVSICIKYDETTAPKDLSWMKISTAENWLKVLRVKTGLGAVNSNPNILIKVRVCAKDGKVSSLDKGKQKTNNIIGCQPYTKHRFQQNRSGVFVCVLDIVTRSAPARFHRSVHGVSAGFIPRRRATHSTAGAACQGATGDISSRAAPFPWIGKGRGDRVEPLSFQTAVFPRLMC